MAVNPDGWFGTSWDHYFKSNLEYQIFLPKSKRKSLRAALAALVQWVESDNKTPMSQASSYLGKKRAVRQYDVTLYLELLCCYYFPIARENCNAFDSSFRDMDGSFPLEPIPSSGIKSVVSFEETVNNKSSGPCSSKGVWPLAMGEEQSRMIQLPLKKILVNTAIKSDSWLHFSPVSLSAW